MSTYKVFRKIFKYPKMSNNRAEESNYIHMGIGAIYILTEQFFEHFDELWDRVFLYGEEAVLAGQLASVKGRTFYYPNCIVYHKESLSTGKLPSKTKFKIYQESIKESIKHL